MVQSYHIICPENDEQAIPGDDFQRKSHKAVYLSAGDRALGREFDT